MHSAKQIPRKVQAEFNIQGNILVWIQHQSIKHEIQLS